VKAPNAPGSPGSHPHADRPNWRPAETFDEYMANCREGLEEYSERRAAKLMGVSRTALWRTRLMAEIPEELADRLLAAGLSTKAMAQVALAVKRGGNGVAEVECCPNCGHMLRGRALVSDKAREIVNAWLAEQRR